MSGLRDIDRWFIDRVLPHETRYLMLAGRLSANGEQAADLVHDVYARLLSSDAWRLIEDPRAYVLRMVRNLAIQQLRRARIVSIQNVANLEALNHADQTPDAFDRASSRQRLGLMLGALRDLPPRCREVVVLRRFDDLSCREIAARLGLSLSTVEKRLARGLFLLAEAMERSGMAATTGLAIAVAGRVRVG